jgi:hypothetical protein
MFFIFHIGIILLYVVNIKLVLRRGFEPLIYAVKGRRLDRLSNGAF